MSKISIQGSDFLTPPRKPVYSYFEIYKIPTGNMEARAENLKIRHYNTLYSITTGIGVGLLILVLFWILHFRGGFSWQSQPTQEFYWHPFLMILGMVFMYSQSILVYRTLRRSPKKPVKLLHMVLHLLAFIMSVIGLKAVFDSHNLLASPTPNLYSMHSWIGLVTVIIFTAQFLGGFLTFLYPGLSTPLRKAVLPVHTAFGTGCFILAIISTTTGLTEKVIWTVKNYSEVVPEGFIFNFIGVFAVLYGVLVVYLVNDIDFKRVESPEDEIVLAQSH